ncbi:ion channel [Cytobacillus sp. FJAT-54145]|uniref:Ion channel n=1 Tax=Cytobacillus spartinae TaxID=3299023 RepID=A0ABW6K8M4_9BACI
MIFFLALLFTIYCIIMSLRTLFIPNVIKGKRISLENFLYLAFTYVTVLVGFGLIYILLEINGYPVMVEDTVYIDESFFERLKTSLYFSAVTLFSVGYGDIAPVGFGRGIAVVEALIGYTLPAAFVAKAMFDKEKS